MTNTLLETTIISGVPVQVYTDVLYDIRDELQSYEKLGDTAPNIVTWHRRYDMSTSEEYKNLTPHEFFRDDRVWGCVYVPLYMLDHGGVSLSTKPFANRWDSGLLGYMFWRNDQREALNREYQATCKHACTDVSGVGYLRWCKQKLEHYAERLCEIAHGNAFQVYVGGARYRGFIQHPLNDVSYGGALEFGMRNAQGGPDVADVATKPPQLKRVRVFATCYTEYAVDITVPQSMTDGMILEFARNHRDGGDYKAGASDWEVNRVETLQN